MLSLIPQLVHSILLTLSSEILDKESNLALMSRANLKSNWEVSLALSPCNLLLLSHQIWYIVAFQHNLQIKLRKAFFLKCLILYSKAAGQVTGTLCSPHRLIILHLSSFEKGHWKNRWWIVSSCCWHNRQRGLFSATSRGIVLSRVGSLLRIVIHVMTECLGMYWVNHKSLCQWTFGDFNLREFQATFMLKEEVNCGRIACAIGLSFNSFFILQLNELTIGSCGKFHNPGQWHGMAFP